MMRCLVSRSLRGRVPARPKWWWNAARRWLLAFTVHPVTLHGRKPGCPLVGASPADQDPEAIGGLDGHATEASSGDKTQQVATKAHGSQAPPSPSPSPSQDETIHTTAKHPWLTTDCGWVQAGDLRVGEHVVALGGHTATITALFCSVGLSVLKRWSGQGRRFRADPLALRVKICLGEIPLRANTGE